MKTLSLSLVAAMTLWGLSGCAYHETQEDKPIATVEKVGPVGEAEPGAGEPAGLAEKEIAEAEEAAAHGSCPQGDVAYTAGARCWRESSTGHRTSSHMTFGPGTSGAAEAPWSMSTDSTGAVGDALGIYTTYGASRGIAEVAPAVHAPPEGTP